MFPENNILGRWLLLVALGHVAVGLLIPVWAYSPLFDFYSNLLKDTFWLSQELPQETKEFQRWILALFGPTIASVGVLMFYLVKAGIKHREPGPWTALLIVTVIWAPGDIGISLMHDFWPHVLVDAMAMLVIVPPTPILRARAISPNERITHLTLSMGGGAYVALLIPELLRWSQQPSGLSSVDYWSGMSLSKVLVCAK